MRRYASSGKFRPLAPMHATPLFAHAFARPVVSEPHSRGMRVRWAKYRARVQAVAAMLRAEYAAVRVPF